MLYMLLTLSILFALATWADATIKRRERRAAFSNRLDAMARAERRMSNARVLAQWERGK